ncbi:MAG: MFS transporter [Rhodospirillales bacterium]
MRSDAPPGAVRGAGPSFVRLCAVVLLPFGMGYFLSYLFRAVNAALAPDIVRELDLGASMLGVLTAAYLLSFAAFQPVLGVLLDRFGPRRVQTGLLATAALGAFLFSLGDGPWPLALARALIGLGFSGGLMSSFKAVVLWFPAQRVPLANSLVMAFGGLGVVVATQPANLMSEALGWRAVFVALAAVTALVSVSLYFVVPERAGGSQPGTPLKRQVGEIGRIFRDPVFWRLTPLVCTTNGGYIAIQTLWIGGWLRDVAGFDRGYAADVMMAMAFAFSAGSLAQGFIADRLLRRGIGVLTTMLWTMAIYFLAQLGIVLEWVSAAPALWIAFGMTGSVAVLAYPVLSQHFGATLAGRSNTSINLLMFGTAFAVQSLIGVVLDFWAFEKGVSYHPRGYQIAFGAVLASQLLSVAWYWFAGGRRTGG